MSKCRSTYCSSSQCIKIEVELMVETLKFLLYASVHAGHCFVISSPQRNYIAPGESSQIIAGGGISLTSLHTLLNRVKLVNIHAALGDLKQHRQKF